LPPVVFSDQIPEPGYERQPFCVKPCLFKEFTDPADVTFESAVFLLLKSRAIEFKTMPPVAGDGAEPAPQTESILPAETGPEPEPESAPVLGKRTFRIRGDIPPEIWNRLGTKILPKLRSGADLKIGIEFSVTIDRQIERTFENELKQILEDLGLTGRVQFE
jgi:hypothetical protein